MNKFKIEKGIPLPKQRIKYPLNELGVGDSFFVASCNFKSTEYSSITSAANYHASKTGKKFTIRSVDGGVRVWRTE